MSEEHQHLPDEHQRTPMTSRWGFAVVFVLILLISYSFLYAIDFVPELRDTSRNSVSQERELEPAATLSVADELAANVDATPQRIIIDSIGVDAVINNPVSQDIEVLDEALLSGVVRYPGSGNLEDHTNMFLFGHSSHLPVVNNELFRVFNDLSKLEAGDVIRVQSEGFEYRYQVSSIELVDATEAWVELSNREKKLTLSTCNSFGALTDRFVVEADYLGRTTLSSS